MREIKFRVWCNDFNEWEKDLCVIGLDGKVLHQMRNGFYMPLKKESHIIEQYTGLKDKNGKEIYEGDIVKGRCNSDMGEINTIVWGDSSFCIYGKVKDGYNSGFALCQSEASVIEIIGNIHEVQK